MTVQFADTNILLYAISTDPAELDKSDVAKSIIADRDLRISVQVLQEFYVQATRSSRVDALSHQHALEMIETFLRFYVQETSKELVLNAMKTKDRFQISYWDAAIIEAARLSGADIVLSEDLANGQDYQGIRISNPFK